MNNKQFPWLLLIPEVENASEWIDLTREHQHRLSDEIMITSHMLQALVTPDKLNIATLGNQVRQLHVHVIARYAHDSAWPNPVWGRAAHTMSQARPSASVMNCAQRLLQLGCNFSEINNEATHHIAIGCFWVPFPILREQNLCPNH